MRIAIALLLATGVMTAGCKPKDAVDAAELQKLVKEREAARQAEQASKVGWTKFWNAPAAVTGAANQFGFRPEPYAVAGDTWRTKGGPVMIAGSSAPQPNRATFAAEGPSGAEINTITFELLLSDPASAEDARKRFGTLIRDYLFQAGIKADALIPQVSAGTPTRGNLAGTPYSIEKLNSVDTAEDRLAVTFIRSGADAPNLSKPQGN